MQGGFRVDAGGAADSYTVQGDIFGNHIFSDPGEAVSGGNLEARWTRQLQSGSSFQILAYYDQTDHDLTGAHDSLDTYDIQAQENLSLGTRHQIVWGGEYRLWQETLESTSLFFFAQPKATLDLGNIFAQDEIALAEALKLTLGLKLEDNNFSGLDYLPNLRLAWQWDARDLVWSAVSRAERTPSRIDRQLQATGILDPSPDFSSEKLLAYELGYRGQLTSAASLTVSTFYNVYDDLRTDELTAGGLPIVLGNGLTGNTYGLEVWGNYAVLDWWRLSAGFNWLHRDFHLKNGHTDISIFQSLGEDPAYQAQLRSQMNLTHDVEFDMTLRDVGPVTRVGLANAVVAGYVEADARVGWHVTKAVELSLEGFNLLHARHVEVNDPSNALPRYISRAVVFGVRTQF
jgi:iron complex outermembrane receptor protein